MTTLTEKQERFCQAYIETGNASEAYRRAYSAENMKPETINVKASQYLNRDKIRIRVQELQAEHRERHNITVDSLTTELEEARLLAMADEKGASAAVSAVMGKAKLHGLLVDKSESKIQGDFNIMKGILNDIDGTSTGLPDHSERQKQTQ